ncbi:MAG: iron-containing redox enzyme family protein [Marmoricola sp.]
MNLPKPRGTLSERLCAALLEDGPCSPDLTQVRPDNDEDAQISLWLLHQLHHSGFERVDDAHEWDPALLAVRRALETTFEERLRDRCVDAPGDVSPDELAEALFAYVEDFEGPSLSSYVQRHATAQQMRQLLGLRSLYQLHEADHTTWVIPRLSNRVKAAVVELQYDEYGGGDPGRLHAELFARGMAAIGLDPTPFAYLDQAPVEALELTNAMTLFALHRRLRAASLGHLAAFEATSSLPSRRMAQGLERLGFPEEIQHYYREHVEADAVHEQLAVRAICVPLVQEDPGLVADVFLGAFTCLDLEARFATWLLGEWGVESAGAAA